MSDNLFNTVVRTMREGLLVVDTRGIIQAVNPAFETLTGYSSRQLVGKSCRTLNCTGCKVYDEPGKPWCGLFTRGSVQDRRCQIVTSDGRTLHIMKQGSVLHDERGNVTGAVETLTDMSEIIQKEEAIRALRSTIIRQSGVPGLVGDSHAMLNLLRLVEDVALSDAPVLILGESGVGKEVVARLVHDFGGRAEQNFIKVNCASLNENLLESELFGHVKGAFTGANKDRIGRFEAASGGSIFLDEIGDISPAIQIKLLRVLEAREIERVGDQNPVAVKARIITATNKDLEQLVAQKLFREDLFYRINVVPICVPPLRDRKEDIPSLARFFIESIAGRDQKSVKGIAPEAMERLLAYDWPGNVRELRNAIEYSLVLCHDDLIGSRHLPHRLSTSSRAVTSNEREMLLQALRKANGSRSGAAKLLGFSRVTIWKRMKKFGIEIDSRKAVTVEGLEQ